MRYIKLFAVLLISSAVQGADYFFTMDAGGLTGYCGEDEMAAFSHDYVPTFVTGALGELVLEVHSSKGTPQNFRYHGERLGWPEGLSIEVGYWDSTAEACTMDPALRDQLDFLLHLSFLQRQRDAEWRTSGREPKGADRNPQVKFTFRISDELAGQKICFFAHWKGTEWGDLESVPSGFGYNGRRGDLKTPRPMVISVLAPCSDADRQRARESHVFESWIAGESQRTLQLADSFIALGASSFSILMYGEMAAMELGQLSRAIQLLDSCYQEYGRVGAEGDSLSRANEYERMRETLLERQRNQR